MKLFKVANSFFIYTFKKIPTASASRLPLPHLSISGICMARMAALSSDTSPPIVVRKARIEDGWEMAKAHCDVFLPEYSFPLDLVMKVDSLLAIVWGFAVVPNGCQRTYLVAVNDSLNDIRHLKSHGDDQSLSLNKGFIVGSLTMDTLADYLPREGPLQQRRTGVAYLSDLLVREKFRRKGIAKELIVKAEAHAKNWGSRAIALHCAVNNIGAIELYRAHGFKSIKIPEGTKWPQPKTSKDIDSNFMMKLLYTQKSK